MFVTVTVNPKNVAVPHFFAAGKSVTSANDVLYRIWGKNHDDLRRLVDKATSSAWLRRRMAWLS